MVMDMIKIAKELNISPSAVRKALFHEKNVSAKTRELVFAHVGAQKPCVPSAEKPSVGVVLPASPGYYWDAVFQGVKQSLSDALNVHFAFYSSMGSGHEGTYALDYIQNLDLLIVAPSISEEVQKKIIALSGKMPVVYVADGLQTPQLATVCVDYFDEGFRFGKAYAKEFPDRKRILLVHVYNSVGSRTRTEGFKKAVLDAGCTISGDIEMGMLSSPAASVLARKIHASYKDGFDCLYCGTGATSHVALALSKLKLKEDVFCVGYENPKANVPYIENGIIRLLSVHNAALLGATAGRIAEDYLLRQKMPDVKKIYQPAEIYVNRNGTMVPIIKD